MVGRPAIWIPLLITTCFYVELESLALSHNDLESANKTCDGKGSCETYGRDVRLLEEVNWFDRNCLCDKLCAKYGDCCVDSPYFRVAEQRRGAASFTCVNLKQFGGVYMVTTCPSMWKNSNFRNKCEMADISDPLMTLPVTSHKTGITYRNIHCALCNSDADNASIDFWVPRLECPSLHLGTSVEMPHNVTDMLVWNGPRNQWGVHHQTWHPCFVDPVIPDTSSSFVRRCRENVIHACAVNWTNADIRNRCEAYTSLVYDGPKAYRNPHCALCNNIPLQNLACAKISQRGFLPNSFLPTAFSVLFDLTGKSEAVGKIKPCRKDQLYDPFFKMCRDVLCPKPESGKSCIAEEEDDYYSPIISVYEAEEEDSWNASLAFLTCPKFLLAPEDYEFKDENNKTIFVSTYEKYFTENEFNINPDRSVEICAGTLGQRLVNKFGQYMGYITAVGLGVSIFFLVLHLLAFLVVPDLQNLSGKNLASLCVALLLASVSFISAQRINTGTRACAAAGIVTYYGYMASFFWMLTMAFDIWRTLKIATFELRVSSGKQWKKFIAYSIWSWTAPLILMITAIAIDMAPSGGVDIYVRPFFGVHSCWFGHRQALLIFFAAPFAAIMIANIGFFASSAHMIFSTTSTTRYTASGSTQRDFRLYIRLALVMGLTWLTGLFAGYLDIDALWYAFIALNTLQGLFIFLAFTCNDKVIRTVKELICTRLDYDMTTSDVKDRRPPSYSWSGGSSYSTNKSNLGSSSEDSTKQRASEANSRMGYDTAPRSKAFEDRIMADCESVIRSIGRYDPSSMSVPEFSKDFRGDLNAKLDYNGHNRSKSSDVLPKINYSSHPELNGKLQRSTKGNARNSTYDRKHLEDTLY
ncbi:hypothetical protein RUM44_008162 [Polyplax serrata]|uniref:G-protein coupled receptors family 2 profile 2 domain-containing protein n=1 Tax=Polyplax serrata TaxID=468196 RepID=A0ABR1B9K4_POLSC